jgi:UDP-N-acetylmuramoylalanine--D-glutamate ligase
MINKNLHYCVVGFGVTGKSCLDFLLQLQASKITVTDTQDNLAIQAKTTQYIDQEKSTKSELTFHLGKLLIPDNADVVVVSPGIDRNLPEISAAVQNGAKLTNDINLFIEYIKLVNNSQIKLATVTGTNGKTTVVHILAAMAQQAGIKYALCGNVGNPILDYVFDREIKLYIIELSSFQLELVENLTSDVACVLNITADHLDRYIDFADYFAVKLKIYQHAKNLVYYRDDCAITKKLDSRLNNTIGINHKLSFGIKQVANNDQDFAIDITGRWLLHGQKKIMQIKELSISGEHNLLNVLASLAMGRILQFSKETMVMALKNFQGLPHRSQIIGKFSDQILWINDSKGTNVGATIAAIDAAVANDQFNNNLIIILGGVNKDMDFTILKPLVNKYCKAAILIGACQQQLFTIFQDGICCYLAKDLAVAVKIAKQIADIGNQVLFSPACASFDMFSNYQHRGQVFTQSVLDLYNE